MHLCGHLQWCMSIPAALVSASRRSVCAVLELLSAEAFFSCLESAAFMGTRSGDVIITVDGLAVVYPQTPLLLFKWNNEEEKSV